MSPFLKVRSLKAINRRVWKPWHSFACGKEREREVKERESGGERKKKKEVLGMVFLWFLVIFL